MEPTKPEQTAVNDPRTDLDSDTRLTRASSRTFLQEIARDLIVMREAHGADSPIGHRCSNIVELLQVPELPKDLIARQMADLARLRHAFQ